MLPVGRFVTNHISPTRYVTNKDRYVQQLYGRFVTIFFSTWTICHNFILDDLSQVIFVTILFLTICHIWPLDDMSQKRSSDLGRCVDRYGRFATIVFSRDVLSQLSFLRGRFIVNLGKFNTFGMHPC